MQQAAQKLDKTPEYRSQGEIDLQQTLDMMMFNIMNAPIGTYPFPHFVKHGAFPGDFHKKLRDMLPEKSLYTGLSSLGATYGYNPEDETRFVFDFKSDMGKLTGEKKEFWTAVNDFIAGERFVNGIIQKFGGFINQRFKETGPKSIGFKLELFKDYTGYELGPHTDIASRLLNVFFYLPPDDDHPHMGTSFYVPKDPKFTCKGGPHYNFEDFTLVYTVPSYQNTAAAFFRNDKSFHGVEPVREKGYERNSLALMLYAV